MSRRSSRRGISMIYAMVTMVALTGIISLAVDLGRLQIAKTELQQATDAAARYGAAGLIQGVAAVKTRVQTAAAENKVDGQALAIDTSADIEFGMWDPTSQIFTPVSGAAQSSATAIRVTARRSSARGTAVPTFFGGLIGRKTVDMKAVAIAGAGQGTDLVLVQDITSSFADELADAKEGDQAVIDTLYANGVGRSRIAVIVHTGWGKILAPLTTVGTNYSYLTNTISSINHCGTSGMPVCSGTDIASGFDKALEIFNDPSYVAPAAGKAVVLVSDGQPTGSGAGSHPTLNDTQLFKLAEDRADELWAKTAHVYIVFFDRDNDNNAANKLATLIRGNGIFVRVTDPNELPNALADITKKLPVQLVR